MTAESPHVFISYRRKDSPGHAGRVRDALKASLGPDHVFYDVAMIRGGTSFSEVIQSAIDKSDVLVVIIGQTWARRGLGRWWLGRDDWVRTEVGRAWAAGKHVLPVLVEDSEVPSERMLPAPIRFISSLQVQRLRDDSWDQDVASLVENVRLLASTPVTRVPATAPPRRLGRIVYPLGAALAATLVWFAVLHNRVDDSPISSPSIKDPVLGPPTTVRADPVRSPDDARAAVVQVRDVGPGGFAATGFFITADGHVLTLLPDSIRVGSQVVLRTFDGMSGQAQVVGRRSTMLTLIKAAAGANRVLRLGTSEPAPQTSIFIVGVDGKDEQWKNYSARVESVADGTVLYARPEESWIGVMGAPIVDLNTGSVLGLHFGKSVDSATTKLGQGRTLQSLQLSELLKAAGVTLAQ